MKEILVRSITGTVIVGTIIASILIGKHAIAGLFLLVSILASIEYYQMLNQSKFHAQKMLGIFLSTLVYLLIVLISMQFIETNYTILLSLLLFIIPVAELYRKKESPLANISLTLFGIFYIALPFALLSQLYAYTNNHHLLLAFFVILWTSDTFAYLTGIKFGKNRLFERISPKKSWEGLAGGWIFALLAAYLFSLIFNEFSLVFWLGYALTIAASGVFGDLVQSHFKRSLGLKDSGKLLPGHGGLLDRFDAVLLAIPLAVVYVMLFS
jgi:phosphatidate cytidylyltransferase